MINQFMIIAEIQLMEFVNLMLVMLHDLPYLSHE